MTYTYDVCQRLKEECIVNAGGTVLAKYSYGLGKAGERLSITELTGGIETEITYKYDKAGRLVKETIENASGTTIYTYKYDDVGNRTEKKEERYRQSIPMTCITALCPMRRERQRKPIPMMPMETS